MSAAPSRAAEPLDPGPSPEPPADPGASAAASDPAADEGFMRRALELAARAAAHGDVPVGAVVVLDGVVIGEGWNVREQLADPTGHAEVVALRAACAALGRWRVDGATLYVTLEPCPMCAGAIVNARVARVVYAADDAKAGAARSLYRLCDDPRLNHRAEVVPGVLAHEGAELLRAFFRDARARRRPRPGARELPPGPDERADESPTEEEPG